MSYLVSVLALTIAATPEAPREFRILVAGENRTTKGNVFFDDTAAAAVMAAHTEHGADLMIDYEHKSIMTSGAPVDGGKAAGWFKPAVRNGELWATDVEWTGAAKLALKNREYRYFSPALLHDAKGVVRKLVNLALTNLPATRGLQALVASESGGGARDAGVDTLLADSVASGKISAEQLPALRGKDSEWLRGYLSAKTAAAPVVTPTTLSSSSPRRPSSTPASRQARAHAEVELRQSMMFSAADEAALHELDATELKVCRLMGQTPEDYLTEKLRLAKLDAAEREGITVLTTEDASAVAQLSADELKVCRLMGNTPEEYLKTKQALSRTVEE